MTTRRTSSKKTAPVIDPRLEFESDGRAVFIAEGMRAPVRQGGPYVGRKFVQGPKSKSNRNPISLADAQGSINDVIKQWAGLNCGVPVADQRTNLTNFYNIVYGFEYAGADLIAALRVTKNALAADGTDVYIPSRGKTRLSRLQISDTTTGTRGKSQDAIKPSFMWDFVVNNCDNLAAINEELTGFAADNFGFNLNNAPDYSRYTSSNQELVDLVSNSNNCAQNKGWILRLLDDIDSLHLNGQDIQAFFRVFTMIAGGQVLNPSKFRVDNNSFSAQTAPSTRKRTSTKAPRPARVKASLLWYVVQNYCANLPLVVDELESIFNIQAPANTPTTRLAVARSPISKTQSLGYVNAAQGAAAASRKTGKVDQPRIGATGSASVRGSRRQQQQQQEEEESGSDTESDGESPNANPGPITTIRTASGAGTGRLGTATAPKTNRSTFGQTRRPRAQQ